MVEITSNTENNIMEIVIKGEVDASSSIHLDNALESAFKASDKILVNLHKLDYISSAGLGVFIAHLQEMKEKGVKMALFGMTEKVRQVFAILGLEELLTITSTKEESLALINEA
ncbi:MAG: STAS domain-containing protein [Cyclobacteriaceae bacterium]|nr:STAS domain-containing protein [Cyclobacteriaceae bacterium]